MLCTPSIPSVGLTRRLRHFTSSDEDDPNHVLFDRSAAADPFRTSVPSTAAVGKNFHTKTMLHEMGKAAWWELDVQNEPNTRQLQGEIHLRPDLEPSCACKIFTVEVKKQIV